MEFILTPYWRFIRPFTLLLPAIGMLAGALMALGAEPRWSSPWSSSVLEIVFRIVAGIILASSLNAYSNGINQIYDLDLDRWNKPDRPLPSGAMSVSEAWAASLFFLMLAVILAAWINLQCLIVTIVASLLTFIYSAPPLRTKCRGMWANLTIAVPRGTLLVAAGWSTVKSLNDPEPWIIGGIFGAFFLGAVTTKDFADMEGDRSAGCRTLPVIYGPRTAIAISSPFLIFPFLLVLPALILNALAANQPLLVSLGSLLPCWGGYICYLLWTRPLQVSTKEGDPSVSENHPAWKQMYLLTMVAQLGFAGAYLLG